MSGDPNVVVFDCVVFFDCRICESIDRTLLSLDLNTKQNISLHYVADTLLLVVRTNLYSHFVLRHEPPVQYCISIVSRLWSDRYVSLSLSLVLCFAQIVLCVLGRRTGIYFISEIGTGAVPDQHTVPPYSWMRTDILFSLLQNISLLQNN